MPVVPPPTVGTPGVKVSGQLDPARALGLAVSYLMTKPAFAKLTFGSWSRILVGQINRGHYLVAADGAKVVGFLGWALTTAEKGDLWLAGEGEVSFEDSRAGDILLINAWAADDNAVTQALLERLREIGARQRLVYFKRFYPDGRIRPGRLGVNAFVDAHVKAARRAIAA